MFTMVICGGFIFLHLNNCIRREFLLLFQTFHVVIIVPWNLKGYVVFMSDKHSGVESRTSGADSS